MGRSSRKSRKNRGKSSPKPSPSPRETKPSRKKPKPAAPEAKDEGRVRVQPGGRQVHRLTTRLFFEAGLAPGAGKDAGNLLLLERTGRSRSYVLRGTAIAGVLRHAYARRLRAQGVEDPKAELHRWFGHALGAENDGSELSRHHGRPSPLHVADAVLRLGSGQPEVRTYNAIERHTGAVREQGLFSIEVLPPGTFTTLVLHLHTDDNEGVDDFIACLTEELGAGVIFGGHGARGLGLATLHAPIQHRPFDLESLDGLAEWLDGSWKWRNGDEDFRGQRGLRPSPPSHALVIRCCLQIPRGQDICVSGGTAEVPFEPQRVLTASQGERWRIPGSTLRGVFRSWVTRLAARAARCGESEHAPVDRVERFIEHEAATGGDVGWGFMDDATRKVAVDAIATDPSALKEHVTCPVMRLFGSLLSAGRIHFPDALSTAKVEDDHTQLRTHVAIDRLTGGANDGFLFEHTALLAGVAFDVKVTIQDPTALEVKWIAQALVALHLGLLRVGSSKSSGRLAVGGPTALGPHSEIFSSVVSSIG